MRGGETIGDTDERGTEPIRDRGRVYLPFLALYAHSYGNRTGKLLALMHIYSYY